MRLQVPVVREWNQRLVDRLDERGVQASVFFVCERLQEGDTTVELWGARGHVVGNHTHTHAPLAKVGPAAWLDDVARCHAILSSRLDAAPRWFRYPYLGHGDGPEAQHAGRVALSALGYRNVPVTVATTEWMYAYAYRRAADDPERRAEIVADWHRHMDDALAEGRRMAQTHHGRDAAQIVLVHLNELVVENVSDLIDRWVERGADFVDVETAMADPIFALEPVYTGRAGLSWLTRTLPESQWRPYWFGEEEGRVVERFGPLPVRGQE